ncbi:MAG: hypothetical protein ACK5LC_08900, partial [Coprobacillaceae bacterium]
MKKLKRLSFLITLMFCLMLSTSIQIFSIEENVQYEESRDGEIIEIPQKEITTNDILHNNSTSMPTVIYNEEQFKEWINTRLETDKIVYLGANITITSPIYISSSSSIVINTNSFGFIFDGGDIACSDPQLLSFIGEGVQSPVIELKNPPFYWMGNWNSNTIQLNITAIGNNGIGGTALRLSTEDQKEIDFSMVTFQGLIQSYGS